MTNNSGHAVAAMSGYTPGTWHLDPARCDITFSVRNLLASTVTGRFTHYYATIVTGEDPRDSTVSATIDLTSLHTGNPRRDEHLRSETFFDVTEHPYATYRSTGVRQADDGWVIDGDLTMHGITGKVLLSVAAIDFDTTSPGDQRARFVATAQVERREFELDRWTGGGLLSGQTVDISLQVHAVRY